VDLRPGAGLNLLGDCDGLLSKITSDGGIIGNSAPGPGEVDAGTDAPIFILSGLNNSVIVRPESATTITLSGVIDDSAVNDPDTVILVKDSNGTLILAGQSTYVGKTKIDRGTVKAGSSSTGTDPVNPVSGPFGKCSYMLIDDNGATLDLNGYNANIRSLSSLGLNNTVALSANTTLTMGCGNGSSLDQYGSPGSYQGTITGGGHLRKVGSGRKSLPAMDQSIPTPAIPSSMGERCGWNIKGNSAPPPWWAVSAAPR
jgi:autotransporter-associated beta strand protein